MTQITADKLTIRPDAHRGITQLDWLYSRHSFSFGQYYDVGNIGYRSLRVINDDVISPGAGFGAHGHENMEILTWVIDGALRHGDSLGHTQKLEPGELQAISAGSGIIHSEFNESKSQLARILQIWIEPANLNVKPHYDQRRFDIEGRHNRWQTLASGLGSVGALLIHQDAEMRVADLDAGVTLGLKVAENRHGYVHVSTGLVRVGGGTLVAGDAFTADVSTEVVLEAMEPSQAIWFDLN